MPKYKTNSDNERIKLTYFHALKHAEGKAETTIRQVGKAIRRFEVYTNAACFKSFDQKQAVGFKEDLAGQDIALATIHPTINAVKRFFHWLAMQPGYKSKIRPSDVEYLNLPDRDVRAAQAPAEKSTPTLAMIENVVQQMSSNTPVEKRNRALVAFVAITGIRDGALISLKLKHFDLKELVVRQNPNEVDTKGRKRIDTWLFPLNVELERIVLEWISFLKDTELFADQDPLFPSTAVGHDEDDCFAVSGLKREHWSTASPVRAVFKAAFENAGLPPHMPHSFRRMIVAEAYKRNLSVEHLKAWSQNLGHEGLLTTLTSYGQIPLQEQGRLVRQKIDQRRLVSLADLDSVLSKRGL